MNKLLKILPILLLSIFILECDTKNFRRHTKPVTWERQFNFEFATWASAVVEDDKRNYIIACRSWSSGNIYEGTVWLVVMDKNGNNLLKKEIQKSYEIWPNVIRRTKDGGLIVAGMMVKSNPEYYSAWVIKLDDKFEKVWEKFIKPNSNVDEATDVIQLDGGEFVITFKDRIENVGWLFKLEENGNEVWNKKFSSELNTVGQLHDGTIVVAGEHDSCPDDDEDGAWLAKLDEKGEIVWEKKMGRESFKLFNRLDITSANEIVLTGIKEIKTGKDFIYEVLVLKMNEKGDEIWSSLFNSSESDDPIPYSIMVVPDDGYILSGHTQWESWVSKLSESGNLEWTRKFTSTEEERATFIFQTIPTKDGGYLSVGAEGAHGHGGIGSAWVVKFDRNGECPACAK